MSHMQVVKGLLVKYKQLAVIVLAPLFFSFIVIFFQTKEAYCAYCLILMSTFWLTECLPISITALLPAFLFPLFGIMPAQAVAKEYFQDIVMLFYGGLVVSSSIELCNLHKRVSLKLLLFFGSNPVWLMLGFMIITAFMSLWITNAAVCSMMMPIIDAVVKQLVASDESYETTDVLQYDQGTNSSSIELNDFNSGTTLYRSKIRSDLDTKSNNTNTGKTVTTVASTSPLEQHQTFKTEKSRRLATGFMLSCAYACSIGGLGSLVGTTPNVILKGYVDQYLPEANLNFLTYLFYALPVSIILIFVSWLWLTYKWIGGGLEAFKSSKNKDNSIHEVLKAKYDDLGPATWEQKCVGTVFILLVTLWLTRDLHDYPGWGYLFDQGDATPAIMCVLLLFACPKENIFRGKPYQHLVNWQELQKIFPWNVIFLIGGGLVMAEGFQRSGLSSLIAKNLKYLVFNQREVTLLVIITVSALATEFTSNTSIASIFIPIINSLALEVGINQIYLLLPFILSVSLAFMLPVATPPNALIFAGGYVKIKDMIATGCVMNVLGLATIFLAANTWLGLVFDIDNNTKYTKLTPTNFTNITLG